MTRIETTLTVICKKFEGFDTETNSPIITDVKYELTNVRVPKDCSIEEKTKAVEKVLKRTIGAKEAGSLSIISFEVTKVMKYELSEETFKKYANAYDITEEYKNGNEEVIE